MEKIKIQNFPSYLKLYKEDITRGGGGIISIYKDFKKNKKYIVKELYYKEDKKQYSNLVHLKKDCKKYFICPHGIFKKKGKYFILMDYLEGYIPLNKTKYILSKKNRFLISKKIYNSILIIHKKKMTHNDLKPGNIMVNPETLDVRIIDFGSSTIFYSDKDKFCPEEIGYTPGYITINPKKKYLKDELIKNDIDNLLSFLYKYIYDKNGTKKEIDALKRKIEKK